MCLRKTSNLSFITSVDDIFYSIIFMCHLLFMYEQAKFYDKCYLLYAMYFSLHQNNK